VNNYCKFNIINLIFYIFKYEFLCCDFMSHIFFISGDWGLGIGDWAQSPIPNPQRTLKEKLSSLTVVDKNSKEKALLSLKFNHNSSREEIGRKSSVEKTTKLNSTTNMSLLRLPNLNLESKSRRVAQTADAPYNYTTNSLHKTNSNTIYASMKTTGMNNNNISPQNNSMNATEFENFKEYSIYNNNPKSSDLRQFRIPSKKNYQRKKENELMRKTRDNDPYLSTIKDENYNSIKYKQSFNENYKFEKY
jgi:hypothetical protein